MEVYDDPLVASDRLQSDKLVLKTGEGCPSLPAKTYKMIVFLVKNISIDYLIRIDVTTLTTALWDSKPTADKYLNCQEMTDLLVSDQFYKYQYNGFVEHIAQRQGVEDWVVNKSINTNYQKNFGMETSHPYTTENDTC